MAAARGPRQSNTTIQSEVCIRDVCRMYDSLVQYIEDRLFFLGTVVGVWKPLYTYILTGVGVDV